MKVKNIPVLFIFCIMVFFGFQCGKNNTAPDPLIGVWKTSDPTYADRFLEIDRSTITFGIGEGKIDTHSITNINVEKGNLYTIHYKNQEGQRFKCSFIYHPAGQGVITFKNQNQIVWTKEKK